MTDSGIQPNLNIVSHRIALGPLSKDVLPVVTRWMNDLGAQQRIGAARPGPVTLEGEEQWYESVVSNTRGVTFLVRERKTMQPIGTTSLHDIDFRNRATTFGIMIGDPSARGKGFGTETASLMLDYAFTVLGLHSVSLTVAGFNIAGQKAYARAGFRECGRLRERIAMSGRMWDQIAMDCLATEFTSDVLAHTFVPDQSRPTLVS